MTQKNGTGISSVLSADFGSVYTRVVLFDVVDGQYRMVARGQTRTTDGFPTSDLAVGLDRVLRQLTDATGRRFTTDAGQIIKPEQIDRSGVDAFVVTSSVGRPLRAVIVGLMPETSIASALRAAAGTYIDNAVTLSLVDGRTEEERLNAVLLNFPDVILIVGGTDGGARSAIVGLMRTVRLAISVMEEFRRPAIIYAGNARLGATVESIFADLTDVFVAANVRPTLDTEKIDPARRQLEAAFDRYAETRSASFTAISAMSTSGVLPTPQSYNLIVDYLGNIVPGGVAVVDVGSAASILAVSVAGRVTTSIRTDLGLGHNALALLESVGVEQVRRWLPFYLPAGVLENYVANKTLRPATIPNTLTDLYLEHALLKAGIETLVTAARPLWKIPPGPPSFARIIGAGSALTNTGHPAYDALLLLDALQPTGVSQLETDPYGLIAGLGAIAGTAPELVVQVLEGDNLELLGTAICPAGVPRADKPAMRVRLTLDNGEKIDKTVLGGHVWVQPLPYGHTAEARINCYNGLTLNGKRSLRLRLTGGAAGLIFDGRGRPLVIAREVRMRAAQFTRWVAEVTGDQPLTFDEALLQPLQGEQAAVTPAKPARARRPARPPKPTRSPRGRTSAQADASDMPDLDDFDLPEFESEARPARDSLDDLRKGL